MIGAIASALGNVTSGIFGAKSAKDAAKEQYQHQKEFAQHGIQWKVEDAKEAGIHPLYALGANTTSYAPVAVGNTNPLSGLADAGQDISRAVDVTRSASGKVDAFTKTSQALSLQRMGLENELLGAQLAKTRQESNPPMPTAGDRMLIDGQGNSPLVKTSPMARQAVTPGTPSQEAGAVAEAGYLRTPTGWAPSFSKDAKDRLEEDTLGEIQWSLRNRLLPQQLGGSFSPPPDVKLGPDEYWKFNAVKGEYQVKKYNFLNRPRGFKKWDG